MPLRLVQNWRHAYRWGSVQLAALVAAVSAVLTLNPNIVIGLLAFIPRGPLQYGAALLVALFVFIIPVASRVLHKAPPEVCPDAGDQET